MIILDATTKSLEVKLGGAITTNQLPLYGTWTDITVSTFAATALSMTDNISNNGTAVTLITAPSAGTSRKVCYLNVYNADTVSTVVTVQINDNGTTRILCSPTLQVGDSLIYEDARGFYVMTAAGQIKTSQTGVLVQTIIATTTAVATGTTQVPLDDTIPQNGEGDQYLTATITPQSTTNRLFIRFTGFGAINGSEDQAVTALFQDSVANALKATVGEVAAANKPVTLVLEHEMAAGTLLATTFKIRIGPVAANTFTLNGINAGRLFGGVAPAILQIWETTS